MKFNKKYFWAVLPTLTLFFGFYLNQVFSYDSEIAHPYITEKAIELFNNNSEKQLSGQQSEWIKQGSIEEDTFLRYLNHFYNPVTGEGLVGYLSARDWSKSSFEQNQYLKGNQTWQEAINLYNEGNEKSAFIALGHILHLVEDMSVPAHTRNDPHPEGDSYENWVKNNNIKDFDNVYLINLNNIDDFFDDLATYSNNYFLSEDTVDLKDIKKEIVENKKIYLISLDNFGNNFKLLEKRIVFGKIVYEFTDEVHSDYYSLLAPKAISYAAGVIDLFFKEVGQLEKEQKEQGFWGKLMDNLFNTKQTAIVFDVAGGFEKEAKKIAQSPESNEIVDNHVDNTVITSLETTQIYSEQVPEENVLEDEILELVEIDQVVESITPEPVIQGVVEPQGLPNTYQAGFGGGGGGVVIVDAPSDPEPESTPIVIIDSPIVTSPQNQEKLNTNSMTFTGTASTTLVISTNFSIATTTPNENGEWSLFLENFDQGTTTLSFYASNQEQTSTSTPTAVELFVDSEAPDVNLKISGCEDSLAQSNCLMATTTATFNFEWSSSSNDFSYFNLNQNGSLSTTTATTTQITVLGNQNYVFGVSAVDGMGNVSQEVIQNIEINNLPVVISEIAWSGTATSTYDEWIELHNNTDEEINLENWTLFAEDTTPYIPLSGAIEANGYFLIERTDDETVSDIQADLIYGNNGSSWALNNTDGEHLVLARNINNATTTIDEVAKFRNWRSKGSSGTNKISMERYDLYKQSGDGLENWLSSISEISNGKDANGDKIFGTPKARNSVSRLISINGVLGEDKILTAEQSPYFINQYGFIIDTGVTLSLEPGVVVKFAPSTTAKLTVNGTIKSNGNEGNPVVFTSFFDDEYGGDFNGDGICESENASSTAACPSPGVWKQVFVSPSSQGSVFSNTIFRYGGAFKSELPKFKAILSVDSTDIVIENSLVEYSKSRGAYLLNTGSNTRVSGSTFRYNTYTRPPSATYPFGMVVQGGSPIIDNNLFEENVYGLNLSGSSAVVSSNVFKNNSEKAVSGSGTNEFSGNSGEGNRINGILISGNLTEENATSTLRKNSFPYVIDYNLTVVASSTLKIDPGVVVKFQNNRIDVFGRLEINGEEGNNILFTSVSDDSDGTDVNNNPQPEDISIGRYTETYLRSGSESFIKNAEFRYMNYGLHYEDSPINLENVTFRNNEWAIYTTGDVGTTTINNLIFQNNNATSTVPLL